MHSFTVLDIEISREIPEGCEDWRPLRPLGISCAATLTDRGELLLWHGADVADGWLAGRMVRRDVDNLIEYLVGRAEFDAPVLGYNSLGFDLDILQEECSPGCWRDYCHLLARYDHIDIMFQFFCEKGFALGLDVAAKGMGLPGKTEGMHGDLAPKLWAGSRQDQDRVLQYVAQDVRTTADLYRAILKERRLHWTSKRGSPCDWVPTFKVEGDVNSPRLLTVDECLRLPPPDVSWMDRPWSRSKFAGWLQEPQPARKRASLAEEGYDNNLTD